MRAGRSPRPTPTPTARPRRARAAVRPRDCLELGDPADREHGDSQAGCVVAEDGHQHACHAGETRPAASGGHEPIVDNARGAATDKETKGSNLGEEAATPLAADTSDVAPAETGLVPNANATAASVMDPMAPVSVVVKPVANAVATVIGVAGTVPGMMLALPTSKTPVVDVITSVQQMLTSVTDAVLPLASVPNDLYTMFAAASIVPVKATVGGSARLV